MLTTRESKPADAVLFVLLTVMDARMAWEFAQSLALDDDLIAQLRIAAFPVPGGTFGLDG